MTIIYQSPKVTLKYNLIFTELLLLIKVNIEYFS